MATQELSAQERTVKGSGASRRLRRAGQVPAVTYGHGEEPRLLTLNERELRHHLVHHGSSGLVTLKVEGRDNIPTIIKAIQTDPISHALNAIDFLRVSLSETVHSTVPIVLEGEPIGVREDGGILVQALHQLEIEALPQNLPEQIIVDVSALEMNGPALTVSEMKLPEGVTALTDGEEAVAVVNIPEAEPVDEEAEAVEGEGEGEEGAEGETAPDEVPASEQSDSSEE